MKSLAVASRSFSKNEVLRNEVLKRYPDAKFNDEGLSLNGDSLVDFLYGYEKAILALETINESILSRLPMLKIIGKYGLSASSSVNNLSSSVIKIDSIKKFSNDVRIHYKFLRK